MSRLSRLALAAAALLSAAVASAHENHEGQPKTATGPVAAPLAAKGTHDAQTYFTDTQLLTQDGESVRFYSDVLKDRLVLLNVIFTDCQDACPLITRKLRDVRMAMGKELASQVTFISLTSDPKNDTPAVLKDFIRKQDVASPNWLFLTGSEKQMAVVLARLGHLSETPEQHSTLLIAGDVAAKRWNKIRPDAPVSAIVQRLQLLAEPPVAGR